MNDSVSVLELDTILKRASGYASSPRGKNIIIEAKPVCDYKEVVTLLSYTKQAETLITMYRHGGIDSFDEIDDILDKATASATLSMRELLRVATVLRSARLAHDSFENSPEETADLKHIAESLFCDNALEEDIRTDIISENVMSDNASPELKAVRIKLKNTKSKLAEKLSSFTRSNTYSKFLQDNLYTVRNGRYVLPVKNECRQDVPGLLHDQSQSGATAFIEPFAVVEMNNEIVNLEAEEQREIEKVLREFSDRVMCIAENLAITQEQLTFLDVIFAKARYSISIDGIMPELSFAGDVNLIGAKHPLLDKSTVVPIDISLGDGKNVLLISGPNTGGKTVSLKTVGLLSLMLSTGLLIPCKVGSKMAVFDKIYCDIGDSQDISQNLSTFSSHINNLNTIVTSFTNDSLILLDEIGSSTDPEEGAAIAIGVIDYIAKTKAKAIISTHYPQLKEFAMTADNINNAGMQFDRVTLKPTYKLLMGYPGSSNALETANALGLLPQIIETAKAHLQYESKNKYEEVLKAATLIKSKASEELSTAQKERAEADAKLAKISADEQKVNAMLERINSNAKYESKKIVNRIADKANDLLEQIKQELKDADEKALLKARQNLKLIEEMGYDNGDTVSSVLYDDLKPEEIALGQKVVIKSFGTQGVISKLRPSKGEADITAEGKLLKVKYSDLAKPVSIGTKKQPTVYKKGAPVVAVDISKEINVIGCSVDDAIDVIEPILDNADRLSLKTLRIVHGKGTGVLGRGIQSYLRSHPLVKSYRYGRYGEGDNGVTLIEIK